MDFILIVFNLFIIPHLLSVEDFQKHLLLLVNSINDLSLPFWIISACILRYYVIEATQLEIDVCYSEFT